MENKGGSPLSRFTPEGRKKSVQGLIFLDSSEWQFSTQRCCSYNLEFNSKNCQESSKTFKSFVSRFDKKVATTKRIISGEPVL